jgi:hypothetical protein
VKWGNSGVIFLSKTHRRMVRFADDEDWDYQKVSARVAAMAAEAGERATRGAEYSVTTFYVMEGVAQYRIDGGNAHYICRSRDRWSTYTSNTTYVFQLSYATPRSSLSYPFRFQNARPSIPSR